jgi:hypothetical protein
MIFRVSHQGIVVELEDLIVFVGGHVKDASAHGCLL